MQTYPKPTLEIITCPPGHAGAVQIARERGLFLGRNFRAPHHTASAAGMMGEIAIAAGGVLYLDEPEGLSRSVAGQLRYCVAAMHPDVRPAVMLAIRAPGPEDPRGDLGKDLARIGELFAGWEIAAHHAAPEARCSHSACTQHYIDTGDTSCVVEHAPEAAALRKVAGK